MSYTNQDIANAYGTSVRTVSRHISRLVTEGKFVKTAVGKFYNERDYQELGKLLGIKQETKEETQMIIKPITWT